MERRRRRIIPSLLTLALLLVAAVIKLFQLNVTDASTIPSPVKSLSRNSTASFTKFWQKLEGRGPMLSITLRDPTTMTVGSSGSDSSSKSYLMNKMQQHRDATSSSAQRRMPEVDDGTFGISSKLAALFHITPSTAVTSGQGYVESQFADGYMMDGGEVLLGPPSETAGEETAIGGLFPLSGLVGGWTKWSRNWLECISNVHPEIRYEVMTRRPSSTNNDADAAGDTIPFPSLPWLSSASCRMAWCPFTVAGEDYGINRNLSPQYFCCGAKLSLPRISNIWKRFSSDKQMRFKARDLDVGLAYRDSRSSSGGTVELLLGRTRPGLPPPNFYGSAARIKSFLKSDQYRRNNHLLIRLAASGDEGAKINSRVQYARASFRLSTPSFLRFRNKRGKGVNVMPSYDFITGKARCVLSGDVGSTGRTRAVLRLDNDDSTLTLVKALDGNKIIAPTISLQSGKIVYDYHLDLGCDETSSPRKVGSSIRAHVDPANGVILKWTDSIPGGRTGGSCWVTECRIPLGVTAFGPLRADVRVGRRWVM